LLNNKYGRKPTPLDKKTRHLYEAFIICDLILKAEREKGALSEELFHGLEKRGYTAIKSTKHVSMICRGLKIRGVIIPEQVRLEGKIRPDLKRKTYWRINPDYFTVRPKWGINRDFYKTHPGGAFTINMSFEEMEEAMKQRTKPTKKAMKRQTGPNRKDNAVSV
jgi:hypothetical protein